MNVQDMFNKPEIPIEVRIPDALMNMLTSQDLTASRILKLGVFSLLCADDDGKVDIRKMMNETKRDRFSGRRVTMRVPVQVYDEIRLRVPDLSVNEVFLRIAVLYEQNPEALEHV